ncbi:MAG: ATP-binding protein [Bacteroidales bacterium]|nr:ATP-binding protein [Bacteroidales bacterium]
MKRKVYNELIEWKNSPNRKPLILSGARQVGKTWLMKELGKNEYKNYVYLNFDLDDRLENLFETDYNIDRILLAIQAITGIKPEKGKTLIILDEIQQVKRGLGVLKYFCEDAPEYHIIVAGSLLGIALHPGTSFPVGKVNMINVYPLDFGEFLDAMGENTMKELVENHDWETMKILKNKYIELLRQYYFIGGMPKVVADYVANKDLKQARKTQKEIIMAYREDISKHAPKKDVVRINMVLDSIPSQLAKENKKFIFGAMKKGARATEFELAIQWLIDCGIVYKISRVNAPKMPLKFYEDMSAFKLFLLDVGLMGSMSEVPADQIIATDNALVEYKGAFTEEYVMQQLASQQDIFVYYWASERSESELDFLIQKESLIIPVEVKAEVNLKSRSLYQFVSKHPELSAIRFSMSDYIKQDWMENRPLYSAWKV